MKQILNYFIISMIFLVDVAINHCYKQITATGRHKMKTIIALMIIALIVTVVVKAIMFAGLMNIACATTALFIVDVVSALGKKDKKNAR